tara:strand:+ start:523 stop:717 length:195 start_codon:yes stop_codon:yes gene_type:complete
MSNIFKDNFRMSIVSPSGGGKSHLLSDIMMNPKYNLIKTPDNPNGIYSINKIYIFSPTSEVDHS